MIRCDCGHAALDHQLCDDGSLTFCLIATCDCEWFAEKPS